MITARPISVVNQLDTMNRIKPMHDKQCGEQEEKESSDDWGNR